MQRIMSTVVDFDPDFLVSKAISINTYSLWEASMMSR